MTDSILTVATHPDDCGCCSGIDVETPALIDNAPGMDAIRYRVGTHGSFRESIVARLSGSDHPTLRSLRSREDDDFTVALVDGFAVMADVLTFYQERIANESFLRTATERRSVLELARLLGYTLDPGVAATAWLAFALESAPGRPTDAAQPVTVDVGTRVQSVPGPDEAPQTFETVEPIVARVEHNAMAAQTSERQVLAFGDREAYLAGTGHQLSVGDVVVIVGAERKRFLTGENWDVRILSAVEPDDTREVTRIEWIEPLGHVSPRVDPAAEETELFVFRQRAALFGHNAPDPRLLAATGAVLTGLVTDDGSEWAGFVIEDQRIDLDQQYSKVAPGSWVALASTDAPHQASSLLGYVELYNATRVDHRSRAGFGLASKITRVGLDTGEHLDWYGLRDTLVLAQSEEVPFADRPIHAPVYGDRIALAMLAPALQPGDTVAVTGVPQHLRVAAGATGVSMAVAGTNVDLLPGDRLRLAAGPLRAAGGGSVLVEPEELEAAILSDDPAPLTWTLIDADGSTGTITAGADTFELDAATKDDATIAEIAAVIASPDGVEHDRERTSLRLATGLRAAYDRVSVRICANVAPATEGETVGEIVGSGDAARPDQRFALKQAPLTYVSAVTPTGRASTLEIRVNETLWTERSSLYGADAAERAHVTRIEDDGVARVTFGDGIEGARLPTGQANIRATYRKGLGAAGNVRGGQLSTLLKRPLGVTSVTNPEPAAGGEDPETLDDARGNAPLTVLTLERAVSRRDYEDFARAFAGIAKAHALWIPSGPARGVFVTVAGSAGASLEATKTLENLVAALETYGDELLPLTIKPHRSATFVVHLNVKVADEATAADVLDAVRRELETAFGFDARDFGGVVSIDEVVAIAHRVAGVVAVDVDELRRSDHPLTPLVRPRLEAELPIAEDAPLAAEILTIDAGALKVEAMT